VSAAPELSWREVPVATIDVAGLPAPQGSKSAVSRGGHSWVIEGKSRSGRAKLSAWRDAVASEARRWADDHAPIAREAPVAIRLVFRLPRTSGLRVRSYNWATKLPDSDKLTRSTYDALSGIVWHSDSQVVCSHVVKRYAEPDETPGCTIVVGTLIAMQA
jgi:Holliday junction resolvase RusA-like endonuclease